MNNKVKNKIDNLKTVFDKIPVRTRLLTVSCFMIAAGTITAVVAEQYFPWQAEEAVQATEAETPEESAETAAVTEAETEEKQEFVPSADKLNLAFSFPEGADETNGFNSMAGEIYKEMSASEAGWFDKIYNYSGISPKEAAGKLGRPAGAVMGKYNRKDEKQKKDDPSTWAVHSWKKIHMNLYDGNGRKLSGDSNLKEIMAMASVYTYYQDYQNDELFRQYAKALWDASHSYSVSMGDVYYCDGCMDEEDELDDVEDEFSVINEGGTEEESGAAASAEEASDTISETASETTAEAVSESSGASSESAETAALSAEGKASPSDTGYGPGYDILLSSGESTAAGESTEALEEEIVCPGHIDLTVNIRILGLTGKNSLYSVDKMGNTADENWPGWNEEMKQAVNSLMEQDWYEEYGLSITNVALGKAMGAEEIERYMSQLPEDTSQVRRDLVRFALESVGRVPYYWGGKPAAKGYVGNLFGSIVEPDKKGRIHKGLDCSGWISWVYWSVTGQHLPYESTTGLANCGSPVNPSDLKPGDILIRQGKEGHVVMFLGWSGNGRITCIHESSAFPGNVMIGETQLNWKYYRKLVE